MRRAIFLAVLLSALLVAGGCPGEGDDDTSPAGDDDTTPTDDDDDMSPADDDDDDTTPADDDDTTPTDDDDSAPGDDDDAAACGEHVYPWPMVGGGPAKTAFSAGGSPTSPDIIWSTFLGAGLSKVIAVVDDAVVAKAQDNSLVVSLDPCDGTMNWQTGFGDSLRSVVVMDDLVFLGTESGYVHALDIETGSSVWTQFAGWQTSLNAIDGIVLVTSRGAEDLRAFDAATGALLWRVGSFPSTANCAAAAEGVVFQNSGGTAEMYALDLYTGSNLWSSSLLNNCTHAPIFEDGVLYAGDVSGNLYALDASTGAGIWSTSVGTDVFATAVGYGMLIAASWNGYVYAFDKVTGSLVWSFDTGTGAMNNADVVLAGDRVIFADADESVRALDVYSGQELWTFGGGTYTPIADGRVFVGDTGGTVYALGAPY